jgi:hypothetical protein
VLLRGRSLRASRLLLLPATKQPAGGAQRLHDALSKRATATPACLALPTAASGTTTISRRRRGGWRSCGRPCCACCCRCAAPCSRLLLPLPRSLPLLLVLRTKGVLLVGQAKQSGTRPCHGVAHGQPRGAEHRAVRAQDVHLCCDDELSGRAALSTSSTRLVVVSIHCRCRCRARRDVLRRR